MRHSHSSFAHPHMLFVAIPAIEEVLQEYCICIDTTNNKRNKNYISTKGCVN